MKGGRGVSRAERSEVKAIFLVMNGSHVILFLKFRGVKRWNKELGYFSVKHMGPKSLL